MWWSSVHSPHFWSEIIPILLSLSEHRVLAQSFMVKHQGTVIVLLKNSLNSPCIGWWIPQSYNPGPHQANLGERNILEFVAMATKEDLDVGTSRGHGEIGIWWGYHGDCWWMLMVYKTNTCFCNPRKLLCWTWIYDLLMGRGFHNNVIWLESSKKSRNDTGWCWINCG